MPKTPILTQKAHRKPQYYRTSSLKTVNRRIILHRCGFTWLVRLAKDNTFEQSRLQEYTPRLIAWHISLYLIRRTTQSHYFNESHEWIIYLPCKTPHHVNTLHVDCSPMWVSNMLTHFVYTGRPYLSQLQLSVWNIDLVVCNDEIKRNMQGNKSGSVLFVCVLFKFTWGK